MYIPCVAQARNRFFYASLGVPDSLDGRFDMIVLHLFLLQQRLQHEAPEFARFLSEVFFEDMDASIRELGVADTGVARRIKQMGKAYHGRLQAYATTDDELLKAAVARNLYGTLMQGDPAHLAQMAAYIRRMQAALAVVPVATIVANQWAWPDPSGV